MGKLRKSISIIISFLMALVGTISVQAASASTDISPTPDKSTIAVTSSLSASGIIILILILLLTISIIINSWFVRVFFRHKEKFDNLHSKMCTVQTQNKNLKAKIVSLEKNINFLDNWKQQAIETDATIESKVMATQSRQMAKEFDAKYSDLINLTVSAKNFTIFKTAYQTYENLPETSQDDITTDIEAIKKKYKSSKKLKVKEVTDIINEALSLYKPTRSYRKNWDNIVEYLKKIPKEIKDEIDKSTIATVYKNQRLAYGKK